MIELTPDEVLLQPEDYDLPGYLENGAFAKYQRKAKIPVRITREQIRYFGERGIPMTDIERFYNVDRVTIMRYYKADYEKGKANTHIALRNKMVQLALDGHPTMLIWLGKNFLNMSDNGPTKDPDTDETLIANELNVTLNVLNKAK